MPDHLGLWVTDGTSAGTTELQVAHAFPDGLNANNLFVLGNKVLFEGQEDSGLWVTNGTAAGTKQLAVPYANLGGVFEFTDNPDFTTLRDKVLFQGADTGHIGRFWTTDGTSAGTREVKLSREVLNDQCDNVGLQLTVFGAKALFIGHALTPGGRP